MRLLHGSKLQVAIGIYALLYLAAEVLASIPSTRSMIIEPNPNIGLELALTLLAFVLFLVGFAVSWRSELIAGLILVLWYVLMCCMELWSIRYGAGGGMATLLALPGFVFGILLVISWLVSWLKGHRHRLA